MLFTPSIAIVCPPDSNTADSTATGRNSGLPAQGFLSSGDGSARLNWLSGSRGASRCSSSPSRPGGATTVGATIREGVWNSGWISVNREAGCAGSWTAIGAADSSCSAPEEGTIAASDPGNGSAGVDGFSACRAGSSAKDEAAAGAGVVEATGPSAAAIASASGSSITVESMPAGLSTMRPPTSTTAPASASATADRISARIGGAYWLAQTMRASHSTSPVRSAGRDARD